MIELIIGNWFRFGNADSQCMTACGKIWQIDFHGRNIAARAPVTARQIGRSQWLFDFLNGAFAFVADVRHFLFR